MIFEFKHGGKTYKFDDEKMSMSEARWVKREFGLFGPSLWTGFRTLDPDALLAVFAVALRRGGVKIETAADIPLEEDQEDGYYQLLQSVSANTAETSAQRAVKQRRNSAQV